MAIYKKNYESSDRDNLGYHAISLVKTFAVSGDYRQASEVAFQAFNLLGEASSEYYAYAKLAWGIALVFEDPTRAIRFLETSFEFFGDPIKADFYTTAGSYLIKAHRTLGNYDKGQEIFKLLNPYIANLGRTGLFLLTGQKSFPTALNPTISIGEAKHNTLEVNFLGNSHVVLIQGVKVDLGLKWKELLALLIYYPQGLTGEQILSYLYGDGGTLTTLKSMISRLRKQIEIESRPYRLRHSIAADFIELDRLLNDQRINEAISLYRGPLLPKSGAPKVVELRDLLEEKMRAVVLNSKDVDAISDYLIYYPDDLEVIESLLQSVPKSDSRYLLYSKRFDKLIGEWNI